MRKLLSFLLFAFCYLLFARLFASPVWAQPGVCWVSGDVLTISCLSYFIQRMIDFIYPLAAAIALFFLMWGGVKFIRSSGEPKSVEEAKKTMTYALLGLAVIFLIWFILWVIREATGVDLTQYNIFF